MAELQNNRRQEPTPPVTMLPTDIGYIRFFNAVPDSLPVDLYVNGKLIARALAYQDFTEYMRAFPGVYQVQIFPYGQRRTPIYAAEIDIMPDRIYTAAFIGCCGEYEMELVPDDKSSKESETMAYIRFINFAPGSPGFDIYIDDSLVISDINFEDISKYLALSPGRHSLDVRVTGTTESVIHHPGMLLKAGNLYAGYITGFYGGTPPLQILLPLEGASYLQF